VSSSEFRDARVLVVPPLSGGSLSISRYASEGFAEIGASVRYVDLSWLTPPTDCRESASDPAVFSQLVTYTSRLISAEVARFQPDLIFVLAQAPIEQRTVDGFRERGIATAYWFVENYRLTRYWTQLASGYDWFFTAQRGAFHDELSRVGCEKPTWLPLACHPKRHRRVRLSDKARARFGSDVSFSGYGYYNRREMFRGLTDLDFKIWGSGWQGSAVEHLVQRDGASFDEADFVRIASAAKIHVNLHSAAHVSGIDPEGDYLNPRVFELAACGAFQLCDRRSDLSSAFCAPSEIVTFDDIGTLRDAIDYYLVHHDERRDIAERARRRARSEHTYRARMQSVLSQTLGTPTRERGHSLDAIDGFPQLAGRTFRGKADVKSVLGDLSLQKAASDDELLLRMALGRDGYP